MTHDLDPRIHRALDGELDRTALTPEERALVDRLDWAARALERHVPAGAGGLSHRVMAIIRRPLPVSGGAVPAGGSRRRTR